MLGWCAVCADLTDVRVIVQKQILEEYIKELFPSLFVCV